MNISFQQLCKKEDLFSFSPSFTPFNFTEHRGINFKTGG